MHMYMHKTMIVEFWVNFVYCKIIDSNLTLTPQICFTIIILELSWTQGKYLLKIHHPSFKTTYQFTQ